MDLSCNSSKASLSITHEDQGALNIKNYVKDMLKSRIFLGQYTERRLVDKIVGYRDIVSISAAETELKKDLIDAKQKLSAVFPNIWIGISDSSTLGYNTAGVSIWTEIDNQPFGPFWFQIKSLKYRENEIIVFLKCLRHISSSYLEIEPILTGSTKKCKQLTSDGHNTVYNSEPVIESFKDIINNFKSVLSVSNAKELIRFLFALVIAIFTGSIAFINFLGNFVLAFIRESSGFIKNSTPIFLGFLEFLSKVVGGFYILLAMAFRPSNPPPLNKRVINYNTPHHQTYPRNDYNTGFD